MRIAVPTSTAPNGERYASFLESYGAIIITPPTSVCTETKYYYTLIYYIFQHNTI